MPETRHMVFSYIKNHHHLSRFTNILLPHTRIIPSPIPNRSHTHPPSTDPHRTSHRQLDSPAYRRSMIPSSSFSSARSMHRVLQPVGTALFLYLLYTRSSPSSRTCARYVLRKNVASAALLSLVAAAGLGASLSSPSISISLSTSLSLFLSIHRYLSIHLSRSLTHTHARIYLSTRGYVSTDGPARVFPRECDRECVYTFVTVRACCIYIQ